MLHGNRTGIEPPSPDDIMTLRSDLFMATQELGIHVPAVHVLNPSRFRNGGITVPNCLSHLNNDYDSLAADIAHCQESTLESRPLPIAMIHPDSVCTAAASLDVKKRELLTSLSFSESEKIQVQTMTLGQNNNIEWYHQRRGCITGTKVWDIVKFQAGNTRISLDRLVRSVMGYDLDGVTIPPKPRTAAMKWGVTQEVRAKKEYVQMLTDDHAELTLAELGLVVHPTEHYIRASPDGVTSCSCHGRRLLEVKCPYAARHMTPQEAIQKGSIDYISKDASGKYNLNKGKRGYFHQIQTTLAVCGLDQCDLLVWTPLGMLVIEVPLDTVQFSFYMDCMQRFYADHITTEMIIHAVREKGSAMSANQETLISVGDGDSDDDCLRAALQYEQSTREVQAQVIISGFPFLHSLIIYPNLIKMLSTKAT